MMRFCARSVARLTFTKIDIKGLENLPKDLSHTVIVVNHSSYIDSLVLVAFLPRPVSFVAKAELLRAWISRTPLKKIKTQFVERFDVSKSVNDSQRLKTALKGEEALLFFPEGTFTRVPGLKPFHLGAFSIAAEANTSVIPIAITGTRSILRPVSLVSAAWEYRCPYRRSYSPERSRKKYGHLAQDFGFISKKS